MNEADLLEAIRPLCDEAGCLVFHVRDSRGCWGPGYPDLTIVGRSGILFAELKSQDGETTAAQDDWAWALSRAGARYRLWRPADWTSGRIRAEVEAIR